MRSFFETTVDDWNDPSGQLHAYLVPEADFVEYANEVQGRLREFRFIASQPLDALHVTVQRFPNIISDFYKDEYREHALGVLEETSRDMLESSISPSFILEAPAVTENSVISMSLNSNAFEVLNKNVRQVAEYALGKGALLYPPPPFPHITYAYGTASGDNIAVEEALEGIGDPPVQSFTSLSWCAVHQNRSSGTYTYETLFSTPLSSK